MKLFTAKSNLTEQWNGTRWPCNVFIQQNGECGVYVPKELTECK